MRGKGAGREEAVLECDSGHDVGGHGPRTVTLSVAPRVTLWQTEKVYTHTHVTHTHGGSRKANTDIQIHEHTHTIHKHIRKTHTNTRT